MGIFKSEEYGALIGDYTRGARIKNIISMAKVANQRARVLENQIKKGTYTADETAYRRYEKAVETFANLHGRNTGRVGQGKKQYENLTDSQLRNIERRLSDFLVSKGSLSGEVKRLKTKRYEKLKEHYGIDMSKQSEKEKAQVWDALNAIKAKASNAAKASSQVLNVLVEYKKTHPKENLAILEQVISERNPKNYDVQYIKQLVRQYKGGKISKKHRTEKLKPKTRTR